MNALLRRRFALPVVALAIAATGCSNANTGQTAARVADREVSTSQLASLTEKAVAEADLGSLGEVERAAWQRSTLASLIELESLRALAAKASPAITVTPAEIAAERQELVEERGEAELATALVSNRWAQDFLPVIIETQLLQKKLGEAWIPLSDDELRAVYDENTGTYQRMNVKNIPNATSEEEANAWADRVRADPEAFDEIYAEVTGNTEVQTTGLRSRGQFPEALAEPLWAASAGDVVVAQSQDEWYVMLLVEKDGETFEDAREVIANTERSKRIEPELERRRAELGQVEVNPRFGSWGGAGASVLPFQDETVRENNIITASEDQPLVDPAEGSPEAP